MKYFIRALQGALMLAVLVLVGYQLYLKNRAAEKVLVIHSYNTDLPWVGDIDGGIDRALGGMKGHVQLRRHYMNLLNHPDCNYYRLAAEDVRLAMDDWKPDVIVLVDDLAQALVGFRNLRWKPGADVEAIRKGIVQQLTDKRCPDQEATFFGLDKMTAAERAPAIFFAGVNGGIEHYGYDQATNVSGIFEHKNYVALAETLNTVNAALSPKAVAVQLLNDYSSTAISENSRYAANDWSPLRWLAPRNVTSFDEWKTVVQNASREGAMLLIANYQNLLDARGKVVPAAEVIAWTEKNSVYPPIGAATNFVADGGLMTVAISGVEQGEVVIRMVQHYLETQEVMPQQEARQFLVGLNQALVRKRGLKLPGVYEAFSREIGSFVEVSEHLYRDAETKAKP